MMEKNKEHQSQSLAELQQELKSLKALLLSRGPTGGAASPSLPSFSGKPSIPAWQLASPAVNSEARDARAAATTAAEARTSGGMINGNGKGKEMEHSSESSDAQSISIPTLETSI